MKKFLKVSAAIAVVGAIGFIIYKGVKKIMEECEGLDDCCGCENANVGCDFDCDNCPCSDCMAGCECVLEDCDCDDDCDDDCKCECHMYGELCN